MDLSLITGLAGTLSAVNTALKGALDLHDSTKVSSAVREANDLVLKAQQALFSVSASLLELQQKHFETSEELRKLKEALAERGRYALFELSTGVFVYRADLAPDGCGTIDPRGAQPDHYLCQPCFDKGIKSVLQRVPGLGQISMACRVCDSKYPTNERVPYPEYRIARSDYF